MPVDAIGGTLNPQDATVTSHNTVNQDDFIKLFLAQLQFQDPLQPVDNQEFLAQLAQFSNLQQTQQTADNTNGLLVMNSSAQALALIGRTVSVEAIDGSSNDTGKVIAVAFDSSGPSLTVQQSSSSTAITGVRLSQVTTVTPTP